MKLEKTTQEELFLDFETPEPGTSILQIEEGIRKNYNENSGKTTLIITFTIYQVISGPEKNQGLRLSHFVPIETGYGEKQMAHILTITDLIDTFAKNFGEEVEITDDRFINLLNIRMPGKYIKAEHAKRTDKNGREQAYIKKLVKANPGGVVKSSLIRGDENPFKADKSKDW